MAVQDKVNDLIKEYNKVFEGEPNCFQFAGQLCAKFPKSEMYYNGDHIITKIKGNFYDFKGIIKNTENYLPLSSYGDKWIVELHRSSSERTYRTGRGKAKHECLEVLEEARKEIKSKVTISYLQEKIRTTV